MNAESELNQVQRLKRWIESKYKQWEPESRLKS